MPKISSATSRKASTGHESASVLDYLYHDARRVASLLAQFTTRGQPTGSKRGSSVQRTGTENSEFAVDVKLLKGSIGGQVATQTQEYTEETYDPFWTGARRFLDYLESEGLLVRGIARARVGQIVLATGSLSFLDATLMQRAWGLPAMTSTVEQCVRKTIASQIAQGTQVNLDEAILTARLVQELLSAFPHSGKMLLESEGTRVWGALNESFLVGTLADVVLKYGDAVAGDWTVVGILDAKPDQATALTYPSISDAFYAGKMTEFNRSLMNSARHYLGRPNDAYGVTPLIIYRAIRG